MKIDNGLMGDMHKIPSGAAAIEKAARIGTDEMFFLIGDGLFPRDTILRTLELFAEKVMPQLRDLWPDWKDDDRWWIKPYDDRVRPEAGLEAARQDRPFGGAE